MLDAIRVGKPGMSREVVLDLLRLIHAIR
jgi:hypothetical protein